MQPHEKLTRLLPRVEPVEQLYDGLNGKIIKWTLENGNDHKDPSCLAFLVGKDGKVVSKCPGGQAYSASGFSKWLTAEVARYEKMHPRTRIPFLPAEVKLEEDGEKLRTPRCAALQQARDDKKPVLIYVGRESAEAKDKKGRKQIKACRKFEKGTLNSKKAADVAARGWVLLRLDLADEAHAALARHFGVEAAPALLLFAPGAEEPAKYDAKLKGPSLAYHLKKATGK